MTSTRSRLARSRLVRAGVVVGVAALLAGCGSARPGVAASVGEESISISDVDDAALVACDYVESQGQEVLAMRTVRGLLLSAMVNRSVGDQLADEYDVTAGTQFEQQLAQAEAQGASLPDDQREVIVSLQSAQPYRQAVTEAAARKVLADEGVIDPSTEQLEGKASILVSLWTQDNDIAVDPRFDVVITDGVAIANSSPEPLSFPLSQAALDGEEQDQQALSGIAEGLPTSQRCGG